MRYLKILRQINGYIASTHINKKLVSKFVCEMGLSIIDLSTKI